MGDVGPDDDALPETSQEKIDAVLTLIYRRVPRTEWRTVARMLGLTREPITLNSRAKNGARV